MNIKILEENISLSIPAQITSFAVTDTNETPHGTLAKLKVFSKGMTGDKREFTEEFSENLIKTLPGTPVVAYYDEDGDDFQGHADVQYVYGYVPHTAEPTFEKVDGKEWAVVDVMLFTERDDNIGTVARKIIGKAQSLELNPQTLQYDILMENNKLKKIVFHSGSFYGLSVLGDDQQPGFDGSGFVDYDTFQSLISQYKKFIGLSEHKSGGTEEMNLKDFLSLSHNQIHDKVAATVVEKYGWNLYIIDFVDDSAIIIKNWGAFGDGSGYYQIDFTINDSMECTLAEPVQVYLKYEKIAGEVIENKESDGQSAEDFANIAAEDVDTAANAEPTDNVDVAEPVEDNVVEESATDGEPANDEIQEAEEEEPAVSVPNATALDTEERAELEAFRLAEKQGIIAKYRSKLSEDEMKDFVDNIAKYKAIELEKELAFKAMQRLMEAEVAPTNATKFMSMPTVKTVVTNQDSLTELVNTYKNK